mmetsp:Transcript_1719/g.2635  ORF Transcript_1719/g.2635 Transcript_1719/m.2635 type:complete len:91 (+) Transcript_1719:79-351(+)
MRTELQLQMRTERQLFSDLSTKAAPNLGRKGLLLEGHPDFAFAPCIQPHLLQQLAMHGMCKSLDAALPGLCWRLSASLNAILLLAPELAV